MTKKLSKSTLPVCLDDVARAWRQHIEKNVQIVTHSDVSKHMNGTFSVYCMQITFHKPDGPRTMWYGGMTGNPRARISQHKTELKNCKTTTFTGKSVLYSPEYFENVALVEIDFKVVHSGMASAEAKAGEAVLSETLVSQHGRDKVLTRPKSRKN